MQLGHDRKVHAINTCDQRRGHENHSSHREDLYDLVLLDIDKTQCRILDIVQTLKTEIGMVDEYVKMSCNKYEIKEQLKKLSSNIQYKTLNSENKNLEDLII